MTLERYNEICERHKYFDDIIYPMTDLNLFFEDQSPTEIIEEVEAPIWRRNFTTNDNFFKWAAYGGIQSAERWIDLALEDILEEEEDED